MNEIQSGAKARNRPHTQDNGQTLRRPKKANSSLSSVPLTKYGILKRNYMMTHTPRLYLGLILTKKLYDVLLQAQKDAEALSERLTRDLYKTVPMPEEAASAFLARVKYENAIAQLVHETIMSEIIYGTTD
ncbi:MAG: TnpV protein [Clostridiales bacterium]|nr:TnpV protein [Clostridiales bacterium]